MDYEKVCKEALEQAKKELATCGSMDCDAARLIFRLFPQLRESEDERMIKSMTRLIKAFYDCNFPTPEGFEKKDLLAWLEKQKGPNQECGEKGVKGPQEIGDWRGDEGMCKKQKEQTSDIILKAFENSKTDYSLEEREEASDYSEKVLPTSIALGESEEEYFLHKVIEAAYIAGQKKQPAQSFNQEQFFAKKDSTPFKKELFLSLRAIKETKPSDEEIWLNVKEQLTPVLLSLVQKEQKVDIDKLRRDIYQSGYNDGYQHGKEDAQKEQKPAGCADDVVEEAEEYASKVACGEYGVEVTEAYIAGVLSERNRGTGWSEEDERKRNGLIKGLEDRMGFGWASNPFSREEYIAWLKFLTERFNLQPKQEWSEEDEKTINDACCWIAEYAGYLMNKNYGKASMLMGLTEKLKSLRPSWKPSKEQMNALNAFNCHGYLSYIGQQNQLISLYNDLKKLM